MAFLLSTAVSFGQVSVTKSMPYNIVQPAPFGISNSGLTTGDLKASNSTTTYSTADSSSIGKIASDLIPNKENTYNLGSLTNKWRAFWNHIFTGDSIKARVIKLDSAIIDGNLTVNGDAYLNNDVDYNTTDLGTCELHDSSWNCHRTITKVDDDSVSYSGIKGGYGIVTATTTAGANDETAFFTFDTDGTTYLVSNTTNIVTDNTDGKLCIKNLTGNAWSIRNRLGGARVLIIYLHYKQ